MSKKFSIHCTITPDGLWRGISVITMSCSEGFTSWAEVSTNTNYHSYTLYRNKKRFRRRLKRHYSNFNTYSHIPTKELTSYILYYNWNINT